MPMPWLWMADAPLALLFAGLLMCWWPRQRDAALLRVLYLGFAWLPLAFALYTVAERLVRAYPATSRWAARRRMRCSSASSAACWWRW